MKHLISTVYLAVFFSCFFGKAQVTRNILGLPANATPQTNPLDISRLEVSGRLITQNGFVGTTAIPTAQQTGNFGTTARWNSMGSLNAGSQVLNGFRTQTNGRALTLGYSVAGVTTTTIPPNPIGTSVSNPVIQWIGNTTGVLGGVNTPGNLEFKYAENPGSPGSPQNDVKIFTMQPSPNPFAPAICYAESNTLLGQLRAGAFGNFTSNDSWSATGLVSTQNFLTYGARHQFEGVTLISGIIKDLFSQNINAVMDFGSNKPLGISLNSFKFRTFSNPNDRNTVKNVWQSDPTYGNVMMGRQEIGAGNSANFYLSVLDGAASVASATALGFVSRSAIYATTDGNGIDGGSFPTPINNFAAITGDVSEANATTGVNYAILGIAAPLRRRD